MGVCTKIAVAFLEASFGGEGVLPEPFYYQEMAEESSPDLKAILLAWVDIQEENFCSFSRVFIEGKRSDKDVATAAAVLFEACKPYYDDPNHYPRMIKEVKETCEILREHY